MKSKASHITLCAAVSLAFALACQGRKSAAPPPEAAAHQAPASQPAAPRRTASQPAAPRTAPSSTPRSGPTAAEHTGGNTRSPAQPHPVSNLPWKRAAAATRARMQGAWVLKGPATLAWKIEGNKFTTYDGENEAQATLAFNGPCSLAFNGPCSLAFNGPCSLALQRSLGGRPMVFFPVYIWNGNGFHMGRGAAGVVQGDTTFACKANVVYISTHAGCRAYVNDRRRGWLEEPASCSREGNVFHASAGKRVPPVSLAVHGRTLGDPATWKDAETANRVKDYATAKQQVDAARKQARNAPARTGAAAQSKTSQ